MTPLSLSQHRLLYYMRVFRGMQSCRAAERLSAVLTEGNPQHRINRTMVSDVSTAHFKFVCRLLTRVRVNVTSCLCWDFMAPPQETKRLLLSRGRNNPPIHRGVNMKWALPWRSPPPQGRQSKVTSWKKPSIKIRSFLKQSSVHQCVGWWNSTISVHLVWPNCFQSIKSMRSALATCCLMFYCFFCLFVCFFVSLCHWNQWGIQVSLNFGNIWNVLWSHSCRDNPAASILLL